jgi:lipoprotein-anchoring transpeptidase ErfK/SrfK
MRRRVLLVPALAIALASCGGAATVSRDGGSFAPVSRPTPPADVAAVHLLASGETLVAVADASPLAVHAEPGTERAYMHLETVNPWGQRLRLLVVRGSTDDRGDIWLRIQLPIWPNGQEGWVSGADVRLSEETERVVIDLSDRRLTRFRGGAAMKGMPVAVGSAATPTPPGHYFVWAKVATDRPSGPYGSFILGLSGFSETIEPWSEWPGEPRLAIHGTDDPGDAGHAVSHGCVRVLNTLLRRLRGVPMGTPVVIRP